MQQEHTDQEAAKPTTGSLRCKSGTQRNEQASSELSMLLRPAHRDPCETSSLRHLLHVAFHFAPKLTSPESRHKVSPRKLQPACQTLGLLIQAVRPLHGQLDPVVSQMSRWLRPVPCGSPLKPHFSKTLNPEIFPALRPRPCPRHGGGRRTRHGTAEPESRGLLLAM